MVVLFFSDQTEFRHWLEQNHKTETELYVGFFKVNSLKPSMTWSQSVDQALCFGWIDGVRKSIDNESYCIRFTPRRNKSNWSNINIKKMEALIKSGLMTEAGLEVFSNSDGRNDALYSYEDKSIKLEGQYEDLFLRKTVAWQFFSQQAPSYQKAVIRWVMSAKQEQTRLSRLERLISTSQEKKRLT